MMNETREFRRGDIVLTKFPYITDPSKAKERPAVIIQNDIGNRYSSNLIVAAISSQIPGREYPFHFWVPLGSPQAKGTGLQKDSIVHTEVILTIPKTSVTERIGRFNDDAMSAIDGCLRISLALA
jgi:mRNA interferase MazF